MVFASGNGINEIIEEFNTRFGNTEWANKDRVIVQTTVEFPDAVANDDKFVNALAHAGESAAQLESNTLVEKLVLDSMSDGIQLFKQYSDVNSFRYWLQQVVFEIAKAKAKQAMVA